MGTVTVNDVTSNVIYQLSAITHKSNYINKADNILEKNSDRYNAFKN